MGPIYYQSHAKLLYGSPKKSEMEVKVKVDDVDQSCNSILFFFFIHIIRRRADNKMVKIVSVGVIDY